jgi:hypothetical protein
VFTDALVLPPAWLSPGVADLDHSGLIRRSETPRSIAAVTVSAVRFW